MGEETGICFERNVDDKEEMQVEKKNRRRGIKI
jgi:hypothetical protein